MFLRIVREYLQDIYPEFWEQYSQFQLDRFISVKLKFSNNLVAFVFLVISVLHVLRLANKSYFKIFWVSKKWLIFGGSSLSKNFGPSSYVLNITRSCNNQIVEEYLISNECKFF